MISLVARAIQKKLFLTATANFKTISQAFAINLSHRVAVSSHFPAVLNIIIRKSVLNLS